jgi:hypothetical protein
MIKFNYLSLVFVALLGISYTASSQVDFFVFKDVCVIFMKGEITPTSQVGKAYAQKNPDLFQIDHGSKLIIKTLIGSTTPTLALKELNLNSCKYGEDVDVIKYFISNGSQGKSNSSVGINYSIMLNKSNYNSMNCRGIIESVEQFVDTSIYNAKLKHKERFEEIAKNDDIQNMMNNFYSNKSSVKSNPKKCCVIL